MRRLVPILTLVAFLAMLPPAAHGRTKQVVLKDVEFKPGTVKIKRGDRVRWVWRDDSTPHDVTSKGRRRFRSSQTKDSGTHRFKFRRRGTYRYVCTIHPGMDGKVVVG